MLNKDMIGGGRIALPMNQDDHVLTFSYNSVSDFLILLYKLNLLYDIKLFFVFVLTFHYFLGAYYFYFIIIF